MKRATKEVRKASKVFSDVGKSLTQKVTAPLLAIGGASAKVGMEFEAGMSEVKAISGSTGEEFEKLEDAAKEMGKKTSKSAKESAEALKYMALAGWENADMLKGLEPILRLSEAGNLDLGKASDIVTDSMSSLGIGTKDLKKYLDIMTKTSNSSNTSIEELGEAFIVTGGTFKNLKVPLDEASTMLGLLANRGKKGSEAGNALNSIMVNLTSGAGQAGTAMKELQLNAFNTDGSFKGMANVLTELKDKISGMTEEQQTMYLSMIGGKTQLDTLQALLSGVGEEYGTLRAKVQDCDGALNETAATMQDNLKGSITKIKSALEGAAISISEILEPTLKKVADTIQGLVDKFNNLDEGTKKNIVVIGGVVAAIGPLLIIVGKAMMAIGNLKAAFALLKVALLGLSAPVLAIIAAVAALIAIFVTLYTTNEEFRIKVNEIWVQIQELIRIAIDFIILLIQTLCDTLQSAWESNFMNIQGIVKSGWELITSLFEAYIKVIKDVFKLFTCALKGDWAGAWEAMKQLLIDLMEYLKTLIKGSLNFILNIFGTDLDTLLKKVDEKITAIKNVFQSLKDKVKCVIDGITGLWRNFKLPRFKLNWNSKTFMGKEIKYPTGFNINWHAKGGIFTKPTVLGGHGFGEAGKEAILPLNKLPKLLGLDKGGGTANIIVQLDGYTIVRAIGEPLREIMNVKAGSVL